MGYYDDKLAGERLRLCYEIASPPVRRYLEAEIAHVRSRLSPGDRLLELGCGYGRVLFGLAGAGAKLVGVDTARESLVLGCALGTEEERPAFARMDATALGFADGSFDVVACVQNGICAFGADRELLVRETLRVLRPGGRALFSTYAAAFWPHRLAWFEAQADRGLLGPIDRRATGDGVIVCEDGFRAEAMTGSDFAALAKSVGVVVTVTEIDGSSLFAEFVKPPIA